MEDPYPVQKGAPPGADDALARFLKSIPEAQHSVAMRAFRAGWSMCAYRFRPMVRDWERRWWSQVAEIQRLQSQLGVVMSELARLRDRD